MKPPKIAVEVASIALCLILLKYMSRPYLFTREQRYPGFLLGFAFMGASSIFVTLAILEPLFLRHVITSVLLRTAGFVFLAITYYLAKPVGSSPRLWNITLSLVAIELASLSIIAATLLLHTELIASFNILLRLLTLFFITYICIHSLKSNIKKPNPTHHLDPAGVTGRHTTALTTRQLIDLPNTARNGIRGRTGNAFACVSGFPSCILQGVSAR